MQGHSQLCTPHKKGPGFTSAQSDGSESEWARGENQNQSSLSPAPPHPRPPRHLAQFLTRYVCSDKGKTNGANINQMICGPPGPGPFFMWLPETWGKLLLSCPPLTMEQPGKNISRKSGTIGAVKSLLVVCMGGRGGHYFHCCLLESLKYKG